MKNSKNYHDEQNNINTLRMREVEAFNDDEIKG